MIVNGLTRIQSWRLRKQHLSLPATSSRRQPFVLRCPLPIARMVTTPATGAEQSWLKTYLVGSTDCTSLAALAEQKPECDELPE
jgi:hypothetical protein